MAKAEDRKGQNRESHDAEKWESLLSEQQVIKIQIPFSPNV